VIHWSSVETHLMKKISHKILFEGKWLTLEERTFENKNGVTIHWESVRRKTSSVGVVVLAKLVPSERFILIKQYRHAIETCIIGLPAGIADGNVDHALVELKEETGYVGKIVDSSPILRTGSGIVSDSGRIVLVEVDETDPRNHAPKQNLEDAEDIEVCLVHHRDVAEFLKKEHSRGTAISANLWYLFCLRDWIG
jgi:ADP-ribose pyrophosphatase